ncbi:tRNA (adenosine(37)-N6)-threonylcarbamoyltransferase complex dimerization subunit type 1 TsaB [Endozoicomonas sp. SCSIO W0465]|uniref:tRNA (adenosine(37)-N6)-threonylcarbamoyltransferase complex dimerization subunit type 1 TsaB n=1 Tax=Endozoicomonas sp. SCSIO W0465 TaxID=2918516 RepID=UPI002076485B|nr:tRNA (adenosine(37)-N6)-threonylcarbamoyltransferase complex dimerization subunit type 1 TsaB [Endozoicomonas sp. SCSIO W0465]USE38371.1 tRNA (adenosine(37)-N6)-threonylcarbamoyltransferase complex dimerization subunit type 1 TsaB [Endozoicomonas sp. SCSIO W0465]
MKLLALDTSTEACSVALNLDGEVIERFELTPRRHSRDLLPMVEDILAQAGLSLKQLDAVAFGRGPGAFTGLRVATAMVQGLAFAVDLPVIPISTLAALAQQGLRKHKAAKVLSAIDARMDEVYWGAFSESDGLMVPVASEIVTVPENVVVPEMEGYWFGMGTGWAFRDRLSATVVDCQIDAWPHARDIALLAAADVKQGKVLPAEQAMPVYLRDKVALKKSER